MSATPPPALAGKAQPTPGWFQRLQDWMLEVHARIVTAIATAGQVAFYDRTGKLTGAAAFTFDESDGLIVDGLPVDLGALTVDNVTSQVTATVLTVTDYAAVTNGLEVGSLQVDGGATFVGFATIGTALDHNGTTAGFFGTAPTTKPAVTGSRGGNAALASLLTALAGLGLITDSTTA